MKRGRAAGLDDLNVEHIRNSHPIIVALITKLFNLMLLASYVPDAFGLGLAIPVPKEKFSASMTDYRCITVSSVISKIFECCLANKFDRYLQSSSRQLGFKRNLGCVHAIYSLRKTVDYYVKNDSTVNICTLDITKAFDRVNHYCLLIKLFDRNVPRRIVLLLSDWFNKIYIRVRWNSKYSSFVKLRTGVRQGGILSPAFFAIYVDDIIKKLSESKVGCTVNGLFAGVWLYADDIVLVSASLSHLQAMINICTEFITSIDLTVNSAKCKCMRVGKQYKNQTNMVKVNDCCINWCKEIRYLGVTIVEGKLFKCNIHDNKVKFFRAANGILAKLGTSNINVILSLLSSHCRPVLLFGLEAFDLKKSDKNKLDRCFDLVLSKIFGTYDKQCLRSCLFYCGYLPFSNQYVLQRLKFLSKLERLKFLNSDVYIVTRDADQFAAYCNEYNLNVSDSIKSIKCKLWSHFGQSLSNF